MTTKARIKIGFLIEGKNQRIKELEEENVKQQEIFRKFEEIMHGKERLIHLMEAERTGKSRVWEGNREQTGDVVGLQNQQKWEVD